MSQMGNFVPYTIASATSLFNTIAGVGNLYKAMTMAGVPANNAHPNGAMGILQTYGWSGDNVTLGLAGHMKYVAGATVTSGARLTVTTSGYFISAVSGSPIVGMNLRQGVASGMVGNGYFNAFTNPVPFTTGSWDTYDFLSFGAQVDLSAAAAVGLGVNVASGSLATGSSAAGQAFATFGGVLVAGTVSGGTSWAKTAGTALARASGTIVFGDPITVASGGLFTVAASGAGVSGGQAIASAVSGATFRLRLGVPHVLTTQYA